MAITILTGIEDTLALILECGNDIARIEAKLLPALRKLCSSTSTDAETSRNAPSSSRNQQAAASEHVLCAPIQGDVDPLSALDPAVHSLGMLYILAARATHDSASPERATILLPHISAFVQRFDPQQVRLAGDKVVQLAETFSKMGDSITNPESALQLLQALATRFWTRSESLTALHPILAYVGISMATRPIRAKFTDTDPLHSPLLPSQQYLKTSRYAEAATMLLDLPLIDADTSVTPLTHSDVLQYFYYSALIYIKLERLLDAIDALETVGRQCQRHLALLSLTPCPPGSHLVCSAYRVRQWP